MSGPISLDDGKMNIVTKHDWNHQPLTNLTERIDIDLRFTAAQFQRLSAGFKPRDMDDRWFIHYETPDLNFYRSWTGRCIFSLQIIVADDGSCTAKTFLVERDPTIFKAMSVQGTIDTLESVIRHVLLSDDHA